MRELAQIAQISFVLAIRTKVLVVVVIASAVLAGLQLADLGFFEAAKEAGEWQYVARIRASGASDLLQLWSDCTLLVGVILGATTLSSDARRSVLETVLARPIARSTFLLGRWLGIQAFLLAFWLSGVATGLVALGLPRLEPTMDFWFGLGYVLVRIFVGASLGIAFGTFLRPIPASALTLLMLSLSSIGAKLAASTEGLLRLGSLVLHYLGPAELPNDLLTTGLTQASLQPDYRLELLVLAANAVYAAAAFAVGSTAFERRDLPIGNM